MIAVCITFIIIGVLICTCMLIILIALFIIKKRNKTFDLNHIYELPKTSSADKDLSLAYDNPVYDSVNN